MLNPRIGLFIVVFFAVIQFILFCIALHHFLFKHPRVNDEITISHVLRCHRELVMADAAAKRKTSQNEAMNSTAPQNAHSTGDPTEEESADTEDVVHYSYEDIIDDLRTVDR